ncbi:MAG: DUF2752 domain-containing protein [Planctomycetes bacterium]|nr:DUF2752 domain-containing protein [Planctomycetota bacterium]
MAPADRPPPPDVPGSPPDRSGFFRSRAFRASLLLAGGLVFIAWVYFRDPAEPGNMPSCPFNLVTGLYCPGCGSARALHQLLHGRLLEGFALNPLMVLSIPFVAYGLASYFLKSFTGRGLPVIPSPWWTGWAVLGIVVAYWILRNVPFFPFTLLAP